VTKKDVPSEWRRVPPPLFYMIFLMDDDGCKRSRDERVRGSREVDERDRGAEGHSVIIAMTVDDVLEKYQADGDRS
jgi:hypothetical protein